MGEIVTVNFRGDELYGFKQAEGDFIAIRPICDALGLGWGSQYNRIKRDPVLSRAVFMMKTPFGANGGQEAVCLRLNRVGFWLATIESSRITDESVREKVVLYQEECADVLAAHFLGKPAHARLIEPDDSRTFVESIRLVTEGRQSWGSQAARELWVHERLPITPSMLKAPFQGDLFTTYRAIRNDDDEQAAA